MPPLETFDLYQCVVRWPVEGQDGYGEPVVGDAETVRCRLVRTRSDKNDPKATTVGRDATINTAAPLGLGDLIWEGTFEELPGTSSPPVPDSDVMVVDRDESVKDVKGRCTRYKYALKRFRETLAATTEVED